MKSNNAPSPTQDQVAAVRPDGRLDQAERRRERVRRAPALAGHSLVLAALEECSGLGASRPAFDDERDGGDQQDGDDPFPVTHSSEGNTECAECNRVCSDSGGLWWCVVGGVLRGPARCRRRVPVRRFSRQRRIRTGVANRLDDRDDRRTVRSQRVHLFDREQTDRADAFGDDHDAAGDHLLGAISLARNENPLGRRLGEDAMLEHRSFLPWIILTVRISVKVVVRRR